MNCTLTNFPSQDLLRALKSEADALQAVHSNLRLNIQKLQVRVGHATHVAPLQRISHAESAGSPVLVIDSCSCL